MNHVILHYPFGGGGNFVKNCINLDQHYDSYWSTNREESLINYYLDNSDSWLEREWRVRSHLLKHYDGPVLKSIPQDVNLVLDCHGDKKEYNFFLKNTLPGNLKHIFLLPDDIDWLNKLYLSKLGNASDLSEEQTIHNNNLNFSRLLKIKKHLQVKEHFVVEQLFKTPDVVLEIIRFLKCRADRKTVIRCWEIWVEQTAKLYERHHGKIFRT
tara:strand:- start:7 stop:642 length:636 start_codon:yes stop_codon:yes gene_type:complete